MSTPNSRMIPAAVVVLAAALIVGSGAFSAITADRTATIGVAGDDSALLAISPHTDANPDFFGSGNTLSISVGIGNTTIEPLFNVTNQGTQSVAVWLVDHDYTGGGSNEDLAGDIVGDVDEDNTGNITFHNPTYGGNESCENAKKSVETQGNAVQLAPGETLVVSMFSDTSNVPGDEADLLDELTIHADATVSGVTDPTDSCP